MAQKIIDIWKIPIRFRQDFKSVMWYLLYFTVYLVVFLVFYKPFYIYQLSAIELRTMVIQLTGFTILTLGLSHFISLYFFRNVTRRWTVGKELIWVFSHFALISIFNIILVSQYHALASISYTEVLLATILVGIIPTTTDFIYRFRKGIANPSPSQEPSDVLYVKSEGNYIHVFSKAADSVSRDMLRTSLASYHQQHSKSLVRVHKSFLVNMDVIVNVHGNSNGGRLFLVNDLIVPYSRGYYKNIRPLAS
ncbi:MAG: LytTR family transcriptional regulator [Bacteroidia bacterium]